MNVPINFATMSEHTWWWLARATGMIGWVLATASIVWGLALSGRVVRRKKLPAWLLDLHRYLGTLTLAFVAVHMGALTLDHYVAFSLNDLFVPMASTWKPGAVAWGIAAFYVLVVIQVTSWGMRWLPRKVWHGIHFSSFFVFVAATVHGVTAGTDAAEPLVQMGALAGTTLLITLVFLRVLNSMSADDAPSGARAAAAAARAARAATQDETTDAAPTAAQTAAAPAAPTAAAPAPRVAGDAPLDPVLAARLAKLGNRVGRSPQPSAAGGHAAAAEHAGKVDDGEGAGLWAALETEAIERVALDRRRAEERLRDVELVFAEEGDGVSRP
jgi:sulfoxide reductase heme-binding subunit YedZ